MNILYYNINNIMENRVETMQQINTIKQNILLENNNSFFYKNDVKDKQKTAIQETIQFDKLLRACVYIIKDTNNIYIDYQVLKLFANPDNYSTIVDYLIYNINENINTFGTFNAHINIHTFSVTACQRYLPVIKMFLEKCNNYNTTYSTKISKLYIYNTPLTIANISAMLQPFIFPDLRKNIVLYDKNESSTLLMQLMS